MVTVSDLSVGFGEQQLFKDVNLKFQPGNCYGVIGANGAGKSTLLRVLSGDIEPDRGEISISADERVAVLRQDQNAFDDFRVLMTVVQGHPKLYEVLRSREELYEKEDFSEEDGLLAAQLESDFAELGGWEAEAEAATLLTGLGIPEADHERMMSDLEPTAKVRVLLAQALFGNPDILLLDEPTNSLDLDSIRWLEGFLDQFPNTVIVVSHDRHFLNRVCTHIADIDFGHIRMYVGNYDFWYHASRLAAKQRRDERRRAEDKAAELKAFIQRFSSNAAKAKQATSRKRMLEKLNLDDFPRSTRRFPYVNFKPERECGKTVLEVHGLSLSDEEGPLLSNFELTVVRGEKIAFVGPRNQAKTALFDALAGVTQPEAGEIKWGVTMTPAYAPKDSSEFFRDDMTIIDWLKQYSPDQDETYVRGFLGRMLFSGEEALKSVTVLSGGERVRCMLSRTMLSGANALILDEPTNHLDLEAITALNDALIEYPEVVIFNAHDHEFVDSIANRIVELTPTGIIDRRMRFDEYLADEGVRALRDEMYASHQGLTI